MKKFMKILKYVVMQIIFAATSYYAVVEEVAGAKNILVFLLSVLSILSVPVLLLILSPSFAHTATKDTTEPHERTTPVAVSVVVDVGFTLFFVWYGWWVTAIAYSMIAAIMAAGIATLNKQIRQNLLDSLTKNYS